MKRLAHLLLFFPAMLPLGDIAAETLPAALASAYRSNAALRGAEAQTRAVAEGVVQANAGRLPTLTVSGHGGYHDDHSVTNNPFGAPESSTDRYRVYQWQVSLNQPLYQGGAIQAGIAKARADAASQEASQDVGELTILLNATTAYLDLIQAREDVAVIRESIEGLSLQKASVERTLARQDATVVDLEQATGRLEDARARLYLAESQLELASASYRRWMGHEAGDLSAPTPLDNLPISRDEAIRLALAANPAIRQTAQSEMSAQAAMDVVAAANRPAVALVASFSDEVDRFGDSRGVNKDYSVAIQAKIPLYLGGAVSARLGAARELRRQKRIQLALVRDQIMQATAKAWDARVSAQADAASRRTQIKAARKALEGLSWEQEQGSRTVLDVLNGRQELFQAQLSDNKARHDLLLSEYRLLAALGRLGSEFGSNEQPTAMERYKAGERDATDAP